MNLFCHKRKKNASLFIYNNIDAEQYIETDLNFKVGINVF